MYLHKTKNGHYTPPCCYFSGELEVVEILRSGLCGKTEAQTIVDRMKAEKKILIKAYPNVGEFGNCLRVSIGEEKYMKQFMDALLEIDQ